MLVNVKFLGLWAVAAVTVLASPASLNGAALDGRNDETLAQRQSKQQSVDQFAQGGLRHIEESHRVYHLHGQERRVVKTTSKVTAKTTAKTTIQTTLKTSSIKATSTSSASVVSKTSSSSSKSQISSTTVSSSTLATSIASSISSGTSSASGSSASALSSSASGSAMSSTSSESSTLSGSLTSSVASQTATGDISKFCGASYATKRGLAANKAYALAARNPTAKGPVTQPVAVGAQGSEKAPLGLFSTKFGTCMGVAVVGKGSAKTRFMIHLTATSGWKSLFTTFAADVKAAALSDMKVVLRTPDLTKGLPTADNREGMPPGLPVWVDNDTVESQRMIDDLKGEIKTSLGVEAQVETGPMDAMFRNTGDAGSMEVSGISDPADIYVDGVKV